MSMDSAKSVVVSVQKNVFETLFVCSDSSNLNEVLECLIQTAKTSDGRLELASKDIILPVLQLCQYPLQIYCQDLLLAIKLLRNLCAGEIRNQDLFIEQNGVGILSTLIDSMGLSSGSYDEILRMILQLLGNVSLAGERHQIVVWDQFFPLRFLDIARVKSKGACDPLCMVIYTCSGGSNERSEELLADQGLDIVVEILRTVSSAGFSEDWVKLLLSMICFEESYFSSLFSKLSAVAEGEKWDENLSRIHHFRADQAFFMSILSEILTLQVGDIVVSTDFCLFIFGILRNAVEIVDFTTRGKLRLPTGSADIDLMGYTLSILRDICAGNGKVDAVDMLVQAGLIKFLIALLRDLEPPAMIRKAVIHSNANDGPTSQFSKYCPYRGFRRDMVAIIGNCSNRKKHVQDEIREEDGILLMLQNCVTDEDNPFLREWGIWSMRNILDGNSENQRLVADLEVQGSVDVPEISRMGLKVEVDPMTRRPKLVNIP